MIKYQICFYNGNCLLEGKGLDSSQKPFAGEYLEEWELEILHKIINDFFEGLNLKIINVRSKLFYNPDPIKEQLETQLVEV